MYFFYTVYEVDMSETKNIPVRFDMDHIKAIEQAAKRYKLPKSEIIRLTSKAGLKALERLSPEELIAFIEKEIK